MLRSAQPSQFSTYPSQYIDTPGLAVLFLPYVLRTLKEAGYLDWIKFMYEDKYFNEIFDSKLNI